jgi:hypothetical protein
MLINAIHQASRIVNKKLIMNAINSCVVFPKADNLSKDKVVNEIHVESYSSKDIKMVLERDVDRLMRLYAVGAKQDVIEAGEMIDEIAKSAPIDGIRFIQIHKAGVDLLRIYKVGNDAMERAAFLEMNVYKRYFDAAFQNTNMTRSRTDTSYLYYQVRYLMA